jgi:hypothetical protein
MSTSIEHGGYALAVIIFLIHAAAAFTGPVLLAVMATVLPVFLDDWRPRYFYSATITNDDICPLVHSDLLLCDPASEVQDKRKKP